MKRLDFVFAIVLGALAAFVGTEVYGLRTERSSRHLGSAAGTTTAVSSDGEARISGRGAPARGSTAKGRRNAGGLSEGEKANARHRLALLASGTYINEVLAAHDSALARWPERRLQPLRVWIQPMASIADWTPASVAIVRDAFLDWSDTGIPIAFTFVLDSASADVRVTWIDRFDEAISGKTLWSHDDRWWILEANIVLAVHHRNGEPLDTAATRAISLHEVGHLIGLDHTTDSTSIMTPRVRVKRLSAADRATAQLLYLLPPGPLK